MLMVTPLPSALPPADPGARLWRFMDFTKYVAMLDRRAVFFTRADQFADPFEGTLPRRNLLRPSGSPTALRRSVFVNCWHRNDHESAAMWRIYLKSDEGVAIQTTLARLSDAFAGAEEPIHVGAVRYLDYDRDGLAERSELDPFLVKRKSFEYEQEIRALVRTPEEAAEEGRYVPADLAALLERVVISPTAEPWLGALVDSVTRKYGLAVDVTESELARPPFEG
jgi:hypothetical protein